MLITMICPQCGAQLEMDDSERFMFCRHCGTRIENLAQRVEIRQDINVNYGGTVIHRQDRTGEPNLYICYTSVDTRVPMVIRLVSTNQKTTFISGQKLSFRLTPGTHDIVLKIGKINYNRRIFIPETNEPVNIYASWNGRAQITIDQPFRDQPAETRTVTAQPGQTKARSSTIGIIGFVLSLLMITSPIAVVLCIIDLVKNEPGKKRGLSIAGLIIGAVFTLALIASLFTKNTAAA